MTTASSTTTTTAGRSVLVVDDDRDISELVEAVLTDAGYTVSVLHRIDPELVVTATGQLEPDCVLLDSSGHRTDYGDSWALAEQLAVRGRPVPVVMFTAHAAALKEAEAQASGRSQAAHFAGVLAKPFDLDDLEAVVAQATGQAVPFDRSAEAEATRTASLVAALAAGGATDLQPATRREWVTLRAPSGHFVQLYWWQGRGVYLCGTYDEASGVMQPIGQFAGRDAAIACALAG